MTVMTSWLGPLGAHGKPNKIRNFASHLAAGAALTSAVGLGACGAPAETVESGGTALEGPPPQDEVLCDGGDPQTFCDDGNPCTTDVNCTPCSKLSEDEQDIYHCTPDDEVPLACGGHLGCLHVPITTPAGQIDDCFPVAGAEDAHEGVCRAGVCGENPVN